MPMREENGELPALDGGSIHGLDGASIRALIDAKVAEKLPSLDVSTLTSRSDHAGLLVGVDALRDALTSDALTVPIDLGEGKTLTLQKLQGGGMVTFTMSF